MRQETANIKMCCHFMSYSWNSAPWLNLGHRALTNKGQGEQAPIFRRVPLTAESAGVSLTYHARFTGHSVPLIDFGQSQSRPEVERTAPGNRHSLLRTLKRGEKDQKATVCFGELLESEKRNLAPKKARPHLLRVLQGHPKGREDKGHPPQFADK